MREFKVGEYVTFIDKKWSDTRKELYGFSLYRKIAKILDIDTKVKDIYVSHLLEFKEFINGNDGDGDGKGKQGHCEWCTKSEIQSIDHLKFKKWVKG